MRKIVMFGNLILKSENLKKIKKINLKMTLFKLKNRSDLFLTKFLKEI